MTTIYIGRQSGFGLTPDADLYNLMPHGTTFSVRAGAPPATVQRKARRVAAKWKGAA